MKPKKWLNHYICRISFREQNRCFLTNREIVQHDLLLIQNFCLKCSIVFTQTHIVHYDTGMHTYEENTALGKYLTSVGRFNELHADS